MPKKLKVKKRKLYLVLVFGLFFVWTGEKLYRLSSYKPEPEKECPEINSQDSILKKGTEIKILYESEQPINWEQKGGFINDASCLNKTVIAGIVSIQNEQDAINALEFAQEKNLKISIAGQQHTMGGQTFTEGGLILDMKPYHKVEINDQNNVVVQSGATWAEVQKKLDNIGLSVKAMQSINIFTIGGAISANAHGIAHNPGHVSPTIKKIKVLLPSSEMVWASPTENTELFRHIIGGYGLFGIILEAELETVSNEILSKKTDYLDYKQFNEFYQKQIHENDEYSLFYARLSIVPGAQFLRETATHSFKKNGDELKDIPPLNSEFHHGHTQLKRFVINFSKTGKFGKWLRWYLEKNANPQTCITRNQAMSQPDEVCNVTRNTSMYDSMPYLKNNLKDTDILQEYFVPFDHFESFVDDMRNIFESENPNLLNVTIRIVKKDDISMIPYAKQDMYGFVLYFNHRLSAADQESLSKITNLLIDAATKNSGTFYLPYQLTYSRNQLETAYPNINPFFQTKLKYDSSEILTNKWYEKYKN